MAQVGEWKFLVNRPFLLFLNAKNSSKKGSISTMGLQKLANGVN